LARSSTPSLQQLLDELRMGNTKTKHAAIERLAALGNKAAPAVGALIEAMQGLKDEDEFVRLYCVKGLHEIGTAAKPVAGRLREGLTDLNYHVRFTAYSALLEMGDDPRLLMR
jgi:HEAT repeat protein